MAKRKPDSQILKEQPDAPQQYSLKDQPKQNIQQQSDDTLEKISQRKLFSAKSKSTPSKNQDHNSPSKDNQSQSPHKNSQQEQTKNDSEKKKEHPKPLFGALFSNIPKSQTEGLFGSSSLFSGDSIFKNHKVGESIFGNPNKIDNFLKSGAAEKGDLPTESPTTHKLFAELSTERSFHLNIESKPLEKSPYEKVYQLSIEKFKIGDKSKGEGLISLETAEIDKKKMAIMVFRTSFGNVLFQGQLLNPYCKIYKVASKLSKISNLITVIVNSNASQKTQLVRCKINFKHESDRNAFKEKFREVIFSLPNSQSEIASTNLRASAPTNVKATEKKEGTPEAAKKE